VEERSTSTSKHNKFTHAFYNNIPRDYPQLQFLRTDPDILMVPNFLTDSECDRLIQKAQPHLVPCVTKDPATGAVEQDSARTSLNANTPQAEVPSIVEKLTTLTNCTAEPLEILQVLQYRSGQYFEPHTDGFEGPITACGFQNLARLVTIFCYLNQVQEGGATRFVDLDLDIAPQKGMAVIHFPTTMGFEEDYRTQYEGRIVIDEKWLLVTWVWMHPRDETSIFAEKWLDPLDEERI
jgi:prolyl 4-hydroxylase